MRSRALLTAAATVALAGVATAPAAQASWDPPQLLSTTPSGQAPDRSSDPAISDDGHFAVFTTDSHDVVALPEAPGTYRQGAIVRRDLTTGALAFVAGGALFDEGVALDQITRAHFRGAERPSVSADGRYVAFVTDEALAPGDANGANDVYVRDMARAPGDPDAYILVSALDGSAQAPTYDAGATANLSGRQAISADGRSVIFWTTGGSDLPSGDHTDGGQVLVRQLDTRRTLLQTATPDGTPAGSVDALAGMVAVLSADGATASWLSPRDATPAMVAVPEPELADADNQHFALWRRVAGGPVQRPLAAVDRDDPGCPPGGTPSAIYPDYPIAGPCDGPVVAANGDPTTETVGLSLSADGSRLLLLTRGGPRGVLPNVGGIDLAWMDLRAGLTRKAAYHEITREGAGGPRSSPITDVVLSRNGRFAAVTTDRTRFDGTLRQTGAQSPTFQSGLTDVYVADFAQNTISLLSSADDGGKGDGSSGAPAVADDGTVVFASDATRLVPDDGNSATDVFAARVHVTTEQAAGDVLSQSDDPVALLPLRQLRVTAQALASGRVRLTLVTPDAGGLRVRVAAAGDRRVALATGSARATGTTTLTVTPKLADRRRIRAKRGLRVTLGATFRDGAGTLTRKVTATLKLKTTKKSGAAR